MDTTYTEELRELAKEFAAVSGIPYDKVSIRRNHFATFKQEGGSSGGWTESGTSLTVPIAVIRTYLNSKAQESTQDKE